MFIGHYAPAFAAATVRRAPKLGTLFIAAQLVDIAFFTFVLTGTEHLRLVPGMTVMNPMDLYDMPWTHSLTGALGWSVAFAVAIRLVARDWRPAWIGGAVVFSHWLLDLLVHRPDLTIAGAPPALGLGLWNHPAIEIPVELLFAFGGLAFFALRTRATGWQGHISIAALALAMAAFQAVNWLGAPPTTIIDPVPASLPLMGLLAYLLLAALAWWSAATRPLRQRTDFTANPMREQ